MRLIGLWDRSRPFRIGLMRQVHVTLVLLLVLVQSMLVSPAAGQLVLCLGSDGHVAVETFHNPCSSEALAAICCPIEPQTGWTIQPVKGDCQDLALTMGDDALLAQRDLTRLADLLDALIPLPPLAWETTESSAADLPSAAASLSTCRQEPVHTAVSLAIVRSVTLLI